MPQIRKQLTVKSNVDALSEVESVVDQMHENGHIPSEHYGNVMVATTEAFLNAVNHGNAEDDSKHIRIDIEMEEAKCQITISDEGHGFDYENIPDPTSPENLEKVSGRGLFIIKNLADELEFERNGATMIMTFKLSPSELAEA